MDDVKASTTSIGTAEMLHEIMRNHASSVWMLINAKKSAILMKIETPLPESHQDVPKKEKKPTSVLAVR